MERKSKPNMKMTIFLATGAINCCLSTYIQLMTITLGYV